ncbi:hypothetical protein F5Y10DRAFT_268668 [Nemania abortiva]|nr:hypothetical protein F5Y10DRAFT_268668 [Nemania abortiva]
MDNWALASLERCLKDLEEKDTHVTKHLFWQLGDNNANIARRLQKLEDKDAIVTLMNQYCKNVDNHQWDGYANCFLKNGVIKLEDGSSVVGRADIADQMSKLGNSFQGLLHSLTNIDLNLDGNEATGLCYLWFASIVDMSKPY